MSRASGNVPRVQPFNAVLPDLNTLDSDTLKALLIEKHTVVLEQHAELISHKNEIENLKLLIAKLKRMQFGRSSEKLNQQIEQLELRLEDLETNRLGFEFEILVLQGPRSRLPLPDNRERFQRKQSWTQSLGKISAIG